MIVTLVAYLCTTAAHTDCQVYAHSRYEGQNPVARCELVRETLLATADDPRLVELACEPEAEVIGG